MAAFSDKMGHMLQEPESLPPPGTRVALAIGAPLIGAIILSTLLATLLGDRPGQDPAGTASTALILGWVGIISWLIGLRWYGRDGLGLRGKRPLYASIGFAVMGWVAIMLVRVILVASNPEKLIADGFGRTFLYLLVFEAFCVQLWLFGLVFRSIADWRGPLTAAITSGIIFGAVAHQFFQESYITGWSAILAFMAWGVFYGLIRLRTGSFLGIALVQAMQTLTTWYILLPQDPPAIDQLQNFYLVSSALLVIFMWRLWPKTEEDYRV